MFSLRNGIHNSGSSSKAFFHCAPSRDATTAVFYDRRDAASSCIFGLLRERGIKRSRGCHHRVSNLPLSSLSCGDFSYQNVFKVSVIYVMIPGNERKYHFNDALRWGSRITLLGRRNISLFTFSHKAY